MSGARGTGLRQLLLPFDTRERHSFESFLVREDAEAVAALKTLADANGARHVYLWSESGCGKTHLLQALCRQFAGLGRPAAYVPLRQAVREYEPALLQYPEAPSVLCVDDVDAASGRSHWELALFGAYNAVHDAGCAMVVTASTPPAELPIGLADLKSRLASGLCLRLRGLDDEGKRRVLRGIAARRGFDLPGEVADFMLNRLPRNLSHLVDVLDGLDAASLSAHRRLTVPFVRQRLEEGLDDLQPAGRRPGESSTRED
jgi:DnaA family protein